MDGDWPTGEETNFDMVLMNPPYSAKWSAAAGFLQDERFSDYGVLAPKSKADYAFLLHVAWNYGDRIASWCFIQRGNGRENKRKITPGK